MTSTRVDRAPGAVSHALPQTVIVLGASGFIGRNLVRRLRGEIARILPVSASAIAVDGIPGLRLGDLANVEIGPDAALVDVAAYRYDAARFATAQAEILVRNVEIVGQVYELCARRGISEIRSASSIAIYPAAETEFDDGAPIDLNSEPHESESMYAWSKRIGEIYGRLFARQYDINTIAFRLTNPFGPYDSLDEAKAHVVPAFIIRALTGTGPFAIRGNPRASRDFIYVGDVCEVICRSLAVRGQRGHYNLGSGENVTIDQLARTILRLVGRESEIVTSGSDGSAVAERRSRNHRVRADFRIERFTSLEDGLVPTIEWYRDACRR
jgi:nucleoside-diphosphate-sugar epimerase